MTAPWVRARVVSKWIPRFQGRDMAHTFTHFYKDYWVSQPSARGLGVLFSTFSEGSLEPNLTLLQK